MRMNDDVRSGIRAYLDAVAFHVKHLSQEDRRDLLENIECHIHEALAARVAGKATTADLEAVLAEMDPPERYADRDAFVPPAKRTAAPSNVRPAQTRPVSVTAGDVWWNASYHLVIPIGTVVLLAYVVPRFKEFFEDMGVKLPFFVALVFGLSNAVCRHAWAVLVLAVPAMALDALIFFCLARYGGKIASRVWTWAVVGLQFLFFLAVPGTLYFPFRALLHTLETS